MDFLGLKDGLSNSSGWGLVHLSVPSTLKKTLEKRCSSFLRGGA